MSGARTSEKIASAELAFYPYPHVIVDNLFSVGTLDSLNHYWPKHDTFDVDYPGADIFGFHLFQPVHLDRLDAKRRKFWQHFVVDICPSILLGVLDVFAPYLECRFGPDARSKAQFLILGLSEYGKGFVRHRGHTHFYADPYFFSNCLIYVGGETSSERGTTMYAPKEEGLEMENLAALAIECGELAWDRELRVQPVKMVDFKPNRFFSFLETPLAWHGVEPPQAQTGTRRSIRLVIGVSPEPGEHMYPTSFTDIEKSHFEIERTGLITSRLV